ncbi:MAG: Transcriptional regulator, BadM/Rrf2 family [uncultured bacterium]|nr:MAG: Transcriptional regulator, BadM/Rrf2 family [uncultured bacterium]
MKITFKGDYALKTLLDLALNYDSGLVTILDISKRMDIPKKFLEQVLLDLKKGGFVNSKRGKEGGYYLAKKPDEIRIGDVIRFIDGPIEPIACVNDTYGGCKDLSKCVFRKIWVKTSDAVSAVVDNITLEDLVRDVSGHNRILNYSI